LEAANEIEEPVQEKIRGNKICIKNVGAYFFRPWFVEVETGVASPQISTADFSASNGCAVISEQKKIDPQPGTVY